MKSLKTLNAAESRLAYSWPFEETPRREIVNLVYDECREAGVVLPAKIVAKHIPIADWIGGMTAYQTDPRHPGRYMNEPTGFIQILYGTGSWYDSIEEKHAILHELAHWLVKTEPINGNGGHDEIFYMRLSILCLKHNLPLMEVVETELDYMGGVVYTGLQMYEERYNG